MALGKENADGEQTADTAELLKKRTKQARHWYEIVRSLRAFYDHFRIAFPRFILPLFCGFFNFRLDSIVSLLGANFSASSSSAGSFVFAASFWC